MGDFPFAREDEFVSVLFKALSKASDDNRANELPQPGVPLIGAVAPARRRRSPVLLVVAALLAVVIGGGILFADDLEPLGSDVMAMFDAAPPARPVLPRVLPPPAPVAEAQPAAEAATPVAPETPAPGEPPAAAAPVLAAAAQTTTAPPATAPSATARTATSAAEPAAATPDPREGPTASEPAPRRLVPEQRETPPPRPAPRRESAAPSAAKPPVRIERGAPAASIEAERDQELRVTPPPPQPAPPPVSISVNRAQEAAWRALSDGQYEAALKQYQDLLTRDRDNRSAMLGKAVALQRLGLKNAAQEAYEELLARDPDNRAATTNLMALLAEEQPQQALVQLQRLAASHPTSLPIVVQMGMIHAQLNDLPQAIRQMQIATGLAPDNPVYKLNLAILMDRAGRRSEAVQLYEEVLRRSGDRSQTLPMALDDVRRRATYLAGQN
jgi:Tfp pilus assembly protein PilF